MTECRASGARLLVDISQPFRAGLRLVGGPPGLDSRAILAGFIVPSTCRRRMLVEGTADPSATLGMTKEGSALVGIGCWLSEPQVPPRHTGTGRLRSEPVTFLVHLANKKDWLGDEVV